MPKVPVINQPRVEERYGPQLRTNIRTSRDSFGGGDNIRAASDAVSSLGQSAAKYMAVQQKEKAAADRSRVDGVSAEYKKRVLRRLKDPNAGLLNLRGQDALDIRDRYFEGSAVDFEELSQGLTPEQKALFQSEVQDVDFSSEKNLLTHTSKQMIILQDANATASIDADKSMAMMNYQNPEMVRKSLENIKRVANQSADYKGLRSGPAREMYIKNQVGDTHQKIVEAMLEKGDDVLAKYYVDQNKKEMTSDNLDSVTKSLEEASLRGDSQRMAADLWDKSKGDVGAALEKANKIKNAKLKDETKRRIKLKQKDEDFAQKSWENNNWDAASNLVKAKPGQSPQDVVGPTLWSKLTLDQQKKLSKISNDAPHDSAKFRDFMLMSPQQMRQLSKAEFESDYWVNFDGSHRDRAAKMYADALNKKEKDPASFYSNNMSFHKRAELTLANSGLFNRKEKNKTKQKRQVELLDRFESEADERVRQFEYDVGRKASPEDKQKIMDGILLERVYTHDVDWLSANDEFSMIPSIATDKEREAFEKAFSESGKVFVPISEISQEDANALRAAAELEGNKLSDADLEIVVGLIRMGDKKLANEIISGGNSASNIVKSYKER